MDASACTVILAALTAGAAIAYTVITFFLLREAQRQTEGQIAPVVTVALDDFYGKATLENVGKGVAVKGNVTITLEPDRDAMKTYQFRLAENVPGKLSVALPVLKPGQTHHVDLHQPDLTGRWSGSDGSVLTTNEVFVAYRFHFRLEYESTSGTRYFTTASTEGGKVVENRLSYGRVR